MVNVTQGSAALDTRPPTPPKENVEEAAKLPVGPIYQGTLGQQIFLDTPNESPSSSADHLDSSVVKPPKRVVFSPWNGYYKAVTPNEKADGASLTIRPLPPSRECIAVRKSILKVPAIMPTSAVDVTPRLILSPTEKPSAMLRLASQHMADASRDVRLDAYQAVLRGLGNYDHAPDTGPLADNMAAFLEYARRDISLKISEPGTMDTELATNALKVLSAILDTQELVVAVADEFCTFIAERAVASLERQDLPKTMVDHYMHLLARQKMPQKSITWDRANRIMTALNGLEARLKGNRVVGLKLMIFHRLLSQSRSTLVARAEEWLEYLLASMSSSIKELRQRAIAFGIEAALILGTSTVVSQAWLNILDSEAQSGKKVVESLAERMTQLLNTKDEGLHVPRVWSIVVLFLRSRRRQIERWPHLKTWLAIMERAFNSSDLKVKVQASIAWDRLVFALELDSSTSLSLIKVIRQPIATQLERKGGDRHGRYAKQRARSTFCTMLYYAFRPGASHDQLDMYWNCFVSSLVAGKLTMTASDHNFACDVLEAVLHAPQPRLWDQNRANQLSTPMTPQELPCLDPRWIRHRAEKVVGLLKCLYANASNLQADDSRWTSLFRLWQSFVRALGDASSKEIKVSMETMTAVAHIVSMLSTQVPRRLEFHLTLITEAVATIGSRPFIEKRLLRSSTGTTYEAAETPSSRSNHSRAALHSPVVYLLDSLVNDRQEGSRDTNDDAIEVVLDIGLRVTKSRHTLLVALREMAADVPLDSSQPCPGRAAFWQAVARRTERVLSLPRAMAQDGTMPQRLDHDYKEVVQILSFGIQGLGAEVYPGWEALGNTLIETIRQETCESGVLLSYALPLSRSIQERGRNTDDTLLRCSSHLLAHIRWPSSKDELERAHKQLRGPQYVVSRPDEMDTFDHLHNMTEDLLVSAYREIQSIPQETVSEFLASVGSFLSLCPRSQRTQSLRRVQSGLAAWVEDLKNLVPNSPGSQGATSLFSRVGNHVMSYSASS
ncbi:MAG: hypothetical protein Q9174_002395 [Haloplaca sp. 1 TL-2023]